MSLFAELRRRKVFRVAVVYAATAFVILQAAELMLPRLGIPDWVSALIVVLVILGFPIALVMAWALELTPDGVRVTPRREGEAPEESVPSLLGKRTMATVAALVLLGAGLGAGWFLKPTGDPVDHVTAPGDRIAVDKSIAVLPFADFSPGGDQAWFSDGLAEEILNALSRIPDLRVASRTSSFRFRAQETDLAAIGERLGVAHVLEGSVRRADDRLRITAQLIRVADNSQLWSQGFDRDAGDAIRVQEEIAFEIARTMRTALNPNALQRMIAAGTNSVAAYEAFLRGQQLFREAIATRDWSRLLATNAAHEQARSLDPQFSEAHLAAAQFWIAQLQPSLPFSDLSDEPYEAKVRLADERLLAAIDSAPDEVRRLWAEVERARLELRLVDTYEILARLAKLQPMSSLAWSQLGDAAVRLDRAEDAAKAYTRLLELDARDAGTLIGFVHASPDPALGVRIAEWALHHEPTHLTVIYQAHRMLLWGGQVTEAAALARSFIERSTELESIAIVRLRQACAEGRPADAETALEQLTSGREAMIITEWLALSYLGRTEEAAELLRPLDEAGRLVELAALMYYSHFDPSLFPNLDSVLRRQGIHRESPPLPPYACAPGSV